MKSKKSGLLFYAIGLVIVMYISFICFRLCKSKSLSYFVPYGIYLLLLFIGYKKFKVHTEEIKKQDGKMRYLYNIVAFIPVIATFFVAFMPTIKNIPTKMFLVVVIYGILNGTLEELFWRYTFNSVYKDKIISAYIVPTILFTCWHFSLLFCKNMSYHGGALALVGGAGMMGVIWGYVMYRTKNVKITIAAHILVNIFAFSQLLYGNF